MLQTLLYSPEGDELVEGSAELIDAWQASDTALLWVHLQNLSAEEERGLLSGPFGVHELAVSDIQRPRHPPKLEHFDTHTLLILKELDDNSNDLDFESIQISLVLGERLLVTRTGDRSLSIEKARSAVRSGLLSLTNGPEELALKLVRLIGERYLAVLLDAEDRIEDMEHEMLERPSDTLLAELVRQKADLKQLVRILSYHSKLFSDPRQKSASRFANLQHELNDVAEHLERQLSLARLHLELSDDLIDGYLSLSAHHLNQIMKTLTVVTVIFVPITFMAGIYGMNFEHMPELGFRNGYFFLLGAMTLVVSGILGFFYWRGWLGDRRR